MTDRKNCRKREIGEHITLSEQDKRRLAEALTRAASGTALLSDLSLLQSPPFSSALIETLLITPLAAAALISSPNLTTTVGPIPPTRQPAIVKLTLSNVCGPKRTGAVEIKYRLDQLSEGRFLIVPEDTSSLDDGSLLILDAEVYDAKGIGIRMEDRPDLLGCVQFVAVDVCSKAASVT